MNQIVYYNRIILSIFISIFCLLDAKLLKPSENGKEKEILIINGKRRLYYPVKSDTLVYNIEGPARIEFISRYPVIKNKKESYAFKYDIIINDAETVHVNHRYKVQPAIKSVQHPKHSYTYSGNYFINLDKGSHTVKLIQKQKQKYPVLLRLIKKEFESVGKNKKILKPMIHKTSINIISEGKSINYFECRDGLPLQIEANGEKTLRILTRLEFSDSMGQEESYRFRVSEGKKIIGTYYFSTERSSASQIEDKLDKVPGKWRSCDISIPKGKHRYNVEVLDKGKSVLTRFILY